MNSLLAKSFFYYPTTLMKGEFVYYYLKKYKKNQWLSRERMLELQLSQLNKIISFAAKNNKFYRACYESSGIQLDNKKPIRDFSDLRLLPTVSKSDLITSRELISNPKFLSSQKTTGGSTGEPVRLFKTASALARERAATWRAYEWAGINVGDSQLRFWGVPHTQFGRLKAGVSDVASNRCRVSAFDITDRTLNQYYKKLIKYSPKYIYGYVSAIEQLAIFMVDKGLNSPNKLKSVITTAEILTDSARLIIEKAFGVKVFNEYGCGEVGSIAHECEYGSMHVMSDNVVLEIDGGRDTGEIIITDLHNTATPLIRYRLGDFASIGSHACPCGRGLPTIEKIHGRAYDIITAPSGRKIHPESLIYVFEDIQSRTKAFKQFQAVQTAVDRIEVKIIKSECFNSDVFELLSAELRGKVDSGIEYSVSLVESLEREPSGKMRVVKSLLPR